MRQQWSSGSTTRGGVLGLDHALRRLLSVSLVGGWIAAACALTTSSALAAQLELRHFPLDLPAAPVAVVPSDLDEDGRLDLVIALAYTRWDQIGIEEWSEMDEVEGLVEVLTVVPALLDQREIRVFLAKEEGYESAGEPLPLPKSVLSLEAGPPGTPVVALTDDGASVLRLRPAKPDELGEPVDGSRLELEPWIENEPVLARTGAFLPTLELVHDLNGDGVGDLLLPTHDGFSLYLGGDTGLAREPVSQVPLPYDEREFQNGRMRDHFPLPEVRDVNGDRLPELLFRWNRGAWERFHVARNLGDGRFAEAIEPLRERRLSRQARPVEEEDDGETPNLPIVVFFDDLDGDGRAEYLTVEAITGGDDQSMREEMAEAKRPRFLYRVHDQGSNMGIARAPRRQMEVEGYAFGQDSYDSPIRLPGGFQELNGDGRLDLVTLTLDFSLLKMMSAVATKRLTFNLDFHIWCQEADGALRPVKGLDLSGKFRFNLNNLRFGRLSQFSGDFDGDGLADFVQMGRGKRVTIHRGREDCAYPSSPDLILELEEEPRDMSLVKMTDLDGDGRSDLSVVKPLPSSDSGVTPPVRLDLYLSGGDR